MRWRERGKIPRDQPFRRRDKLRPCLRHLFFDAWNIRHESIRIRFLGAADSRVAFYLGFNLLVGRAGGEKSRASERFPTTRKLVGASSAERPGKRAKAFRNLLLLALFGFSPQAGLYFLTVKLLAPGITSLLLYLYPAFVLLLSAIFLRKKASVGQVLALSMSVIGCMITFFTPGNYPLIGLLLAVLVAVAYGGYLVVGEKVFAGYDSLFSTAVIMTVAGLVYWAWLLAARLPIKTPDGGREWLLVAGIALIATALPITTLFAAMKRAGAANTSLISTIEPVATVILSGVFLGERLTGNRVVGGLFIIAGVITLRIFSRKAA